MWQLISGIVLIGIFFILFFSLKRGYEEKERINKEAETGKKKK